MFYDGVTGRSSSFGCSTYLVSRESIGLIENARLLHMKKWLQWS